MIVSAIAADLAAAGVDRIAHPLLLLASAGYFDWAEIAQRTRVEVEASRSARIAHEDMLHLRASLPIRRPVAFEPFVTDGELGGDVPLELDAWMSCSPGWLTLFIPGDLSATIGVACEGRRLDEFAEISILPGADYVMISATNMSAIGNPVLTVVRCPVPSVPIADLALG